MIGNKKISCIVYTNSKCSDVWEIFIKQQVKYSNLSLYFISDSPVNNYENQTFIYNNDENYYQVWCNFLNSTENDFFIYLQEDFILYDYVNQFKIDEYVDFLKENNEYSFVRLIKSGDLKNVKITDTLYEIESNNRDIFSMQPTIWRKEDFLKIMNGTKNKIWLENETYRNFMIQNNIKGTYHYDNEKKRGLYHYDTNVYPYMATAIVRGKWNLSEYGKELEPLLNENKIDKNKRGIF